MQPFFDRRQPPSRRMNSAQTHPHYRQPNHFRRSRGTPTPPYSQQQQGTSSRTAFIKRAFTTQDGSFDVSRTAKTVDQVIKTVQQVSPYVRRVGSFFIK